MRRGVLVLTTALVCMHSYTIAGQGRQASTVTGRVSSADGLALPGVTITATSPALQAERVVTTDINGVYSVPGLPAGTYALKFVLDGMATVERTGDVALGAVLTVDQVMEIASLAEIVEVNAALPPPASSPVGGFNLKTEQYTRLPLGRTPFFVAELAPGLTDNTPNGTQVTIGGAFAYDNVFLVDGVDVNDNVLGQPNNLFLEDSIQEIQVLTSGLSAEYGRFSGGVVNVITRSGGNRYSGGLRVNLSNPSWSEETPYEKARGTTRASKLSPVYQGTLGGPIVHDRLWVFGGVRVERTTTQSSFSQTGIPYTSENNNTRYEAKLTGTIAPGHTLQGTYIGNQTDLRQPSLGQSIDPATFTTPSTPNRLFAFSWRGVLGPRTFAAAQYSQKRWELQKAGGTSTAAVDSPFLTRGVLGVPASLQYNGPYFDSTDPEQRNNRQLTASLSQLLAAPRLGTHEIKGGFEYFVSTRVGGNSQSASGYVFQSDYKLDGTAPALDANGRLIPRFVPGTSRLQTWMPLRGSQIDVATTSFFVNDHWTAGARLTLDVGARFERATSDATGDISGANGTTLVPRLAAAYDLTADGRTVLQATYGHYAGKYNDVQFSRNTNVGNADRITGTYIGPAGEGRSFAPGFDPANYQTFTGTFPTANVFFDDDLSSPLTREFTVALAREFGSGWGRATYVNRHATDFVDDFITVDNGTTHIVRNGVDLGVFDNAVYRNTSQPKRDYQGLDFQASYRFGTKLDLNALWTVQIENDGTFEGESANNPAIPSLIGDYPEIYVAARSFPDGRVDDFQRHKVRAWLTYSLDFGQGGRVDISPLYRYNSARTYSLVASGVAITAVQKARDPGYARLPTSQSIFFGERGSQQFADYQLLDLSVEYSLPLWESVRPWFKVEVLNLLNNHRLIAWNTSVTANSAGAKDENGLPTEYIKSATYGTATGPGSYPRPRSGSDGGRTWLLSAGVRF